MCEVRELWEGGVEEKLVRVDLQQENGEEYPYGDRRQELVFIGVGLNHCAIQKALDECVVTEESAGRLEAARKLISNHNRVMADMTNPYGLSQGHIKRLPVSALRWGELCAAGAGCHLAKSKSSNWSGSEAMIRSWRS